LCLVVQNRLPVLTKRVATSRDTPRQFGRLVNFYRVLGVRPSADGMKIKAAYRALVKQFHPDFNAGDARAEQRTKEINRAYQTLGEPEARAVYDVELARQRAEARGRFLKGMATGLAVFLLTISLIPLATYLVRQYPAILRLQTTENSAPPEKERMDARSGTELGESDGPIPISPQHAYRAPPQEIVPLHGEFARTASLEDAVQTGDKRAARPTIREGAAGGLSPERAIAIPTEVRAAATPTPKVPLKTETASTALPSIVHEQQASPEPTASPAAPRAKPTSWGVYRNARLGFTLRYPADVFTSGKNEVENDDRLLTSRDGRALLRIFARPNRANTITLYRRSLIAERYADAMFDYTPQHHNWFVLSGRVGGEMFYERITFSCDRRSIHGWLLVYPLAERPFFDAIVEEIHRSYRYDFGPKARCGEPERTGALKRQEQSRAADMTKSE
jgi:curved DNA-binding protein CbpA